MSHEIPDSWEEKLKDTIQASFKQVHDELQLLRRQQKGTFNELNVIFNRIEEGLEKNVSLTKMLGVAANVRSQVETCPIAEVGKSTIESSPPLAEESLVEPQVQVRQEEIVSVNGAETPSKEKAGLSNDDQESLPDLDSNDLLMSEFSKLAAHLSETTDGVKLKEECIRFLTTKVAANRMWLIRKELLCLKKENNYFKFGKLCPLAATLMHDVFCQLLR